MKLLKEYQLSTLVVRFDSLGWTVTHDDSNIMVAINAKQAMLLCKMIRRAAMLDHLPNTLGKI